MHPMCLCNTEGQVLFCVYTYTGYFSYIMSSLRLAFEMAFEL
jgi:hypothetical protein